MQKIVGDWEFLSKASEFNFNEYIDRLDYLGFIDIYESNYTDFAKFKLNAWDGSIFGKDLFNESFFEVEGFLRIRKKDDDIEVMYEMWPSRKVIRMEKIECIFSFIRNAIIPIMAGMFILIFGWNLSRNLSIIIFLICMGILAVFMYEFHRAWIYLTTEADEENFDPETNYSLNSQKSRFTYYLLDKEKGWLE